MSLRYAVQKAAEAINEGWTFDRLDRLVLPILETALRVDSEQLDCRTCGRHSAGHCTSSEVCTDADHYRAHGAVQLWERSC